jgi:hypothetical protein
MHHLEVLTKPRIPTVSLRLTVGIARYSYDPAWTTRRRLLLARMRVVGPRHEALWTYPREQHHVTYARLARIGRDLWGL